MPSRVHQSSLTTMASSLLGKVALVTGGAQGLGRAFAEHLLERGAKVSLVDVNRQVGKRTEDDLKKQYGSDSTRFVPCDVSNKAQLEGAFNETIKTFGGLDIVVNNAGIGDEINWDKMIAINLNAVIHGSYLGLNAMRTDQGGRGGVIINTSSIAAINAPPLLPSYSASKFGVLGFTRSFASSYPVELLGVRICCICPTVAKTEIMDNIRRAVRELKSSVVNVQAEELLKAIEDMGEMLPSEVAKGLMRLVDDERAHGAALIVSPAGHQYKYPKHLAGKL